MGEKPWKRQQREEAEKLGAKRIPSGTPGAPDARSDWLSIEVRSRQKLPRWITGAVALARVKAKSSQLGIAVLHQAGEGDSLVVMSRRDFVAQFGGEKEERS